MERLLLTCGGVVGFDTENAVELDGPRILQAEPSGIVQLSSLNLCVIIPVRWLVVHGKTLPGSFLSVLASRCDFGAVLVVRLDLS